MGNAHTLEDNGLDVDGVDDVGDVDDVDDVEDVDDVDESTEGMTPAPSLLMDR